MIYLIVIGILFILRVEKMSLFSIFDWRIGYSEWGFNGKMIKIKFRFVDIFFRSNNFISYFIFLLCWFLKVYLKDIKRIFDRSFDINFDIVFNVLKIDFFELNFWFCIVVDILRLWFIFYINLWFWWRRGI